MGEPVDFHLPGYGETCVQATDAALAALKPPARMRGMVAVIRRLADAIDQIDDEGLNPAGKLDNVSMPTYLKYAEALGMYEAPAKAKPGPASTASPAQQALNEMRKGLSIVS